MSEKGANDRFSYLDRLLAAQPFLPPMPERERLALVERLARQATPEVQRV